MSVNNIISIKIVNWKHYQHYKNRKPPWIKLHRELLDNQEWRNLSPEASKFLIDLWLIAADKGTDGNVEISLNKLLWCLRHASTMLATVVSWLEEIKQQEFIDFDSEALATCLQHATPEKRREEKRTEREGQKNRKRFAPPAIKEVADYIKEKNYNISATRFVAFYESKGWMVGKNKMKNWKSAISGWHARDLEQAEESLDPMDAIPI